MIIEQVKKISAILERSEGDTIQIMFTTKTMQDYVLRLQMLQQKTRDSILDIVSGEK